MKTAEDREETTREIERSELIRQFSAIDEHTREARVDRYLEVNSRRVTSPQYFARASTECIVLYSDGHYIATVMMTQAVNEGILKFVAERNSIDYENMNREDLLTTLLSTGIFSQNCFEASKQIRRSFRNDVHHMNPPVSEIQWPKNVWMGVSVENQDYTDRINHLRQTDAHIKFLSLEPLIGALPHLDLTGIDWVIVGGESGPHARPMQKEWVIDIRNQCQQVGIPFFFKQWGGRNKKREGRVLERRTWDDLPISYNGKRWVPLVT